MELVLDEAGVRPAVSVERRRPGRGWLPVAGAAVLAVALTLRVTSRFGAGAEPDTVTYLAAAGHLRTGHGFADIGGEPLTLFPPLFPAAVAALEWLGLAGLSAARFLNAAMFGVLVVLAGVWARRISGSDTVAAVVAGVTAISTPMVSMASWALSEPVGIVAEVACLMLLTEALRGTAGARPATGWAATGRAATGWAAAAGLAAALSCLTRYASVVLFPVGIVVLLAGPGRRAARAALAATFAAVGAVPFGAWLVRNVIVAGNATGQGRGESALSPFTSLKETLAAVGAWFLPGKTPVGVEAVAGAVLCAAVAVPLVAGAVAERRRADRAGGPGLGPAGGSGLGPPGGSGLGPAGLALPAAAFVVLGVLSVAGFETAMAIDPPPRFLLPVFVPLLLGAAVVVAGRSRSASSSRSGGRSGGRSVAVGLVLVVVAASLPRLVAYVERADRRGLLDYSTPRWRSSAVLDYLRTHPVHGTVVSDDPYILNLRLGVLVFPTPARTYWQSNEPTTELPLFERRAARAQSSGGLTVVWFPGSWQPYLYRLDDLERAVCLRLERHLADGDVLRSCPSG
ncbi:MAG TPA: hypothetical protein VFE55_20750 [Acidimicrobiia bacterium]|nr:hypothetical protein [Acidimicrobiia bacterium]